MLFFPTHSTFVSHSIHSIHSFFLRLEKRKKKHIIFFGRRSFFSLQYSNFFPNRNICIILKCSLTRTICSGMLTVFKFYHALQSSPKSNRKISAKIHHRISHLSLIRSEWIPKATIPVASLMKFMEKKRDEEMLRFNQRTVPLHVFANIFIFAFFHPASIRCDWSENSRR